MKRWNQMGRHVRKGEKGIAILAPCRYRADANDQEVVAPDQNDPKWVVRGSGSPTSSTPHRPTVHPSSSHRCRSSSKEVCPRGVGRAAEYAAADGWSVEVEPTLGDDGRGPNGFTNFATKRIVVGEHCEPRQAVKTLAHEIGHKMLHGDTPLEERHRGTREVEAESVAYVVMNGLGIDSSDYTDAYVLHWAAGDVDLVRKTAENVRRVAGEVLDAAYERVPELDRNKAIEAEAVERHQAHELVAAR
ncbi:MAG: ImmA/IrrE family metallo-endopeptidase [Microthrixaceae bacterium]